MTGMEGVGWEKKTEGRQKRMSEGRQRCPVCDVVSKKKKRKEKERDLFSWLSESLFVFLQGPEPDRQRTAFTDII